METQKGDVWVRGRLLLVAIFIGMFTSISVSFALGSLAQAEEADSSEAVQPAGQGFAPSAVYRAHAQSDVVYRTGTNVNVLQFVVRSSDGQDLDTISANSSDQDDLRVWRPNSNPTVGSTMVAQVPANETGDWRDLDGSVTLRDVPTLQLTPFDSPRGGSSLAVSGTVQGLPSDIPTRIFMRLVRASDNVPVEEYRDVTPQGSDAIAASFSLETVTSGHYRVEVVARDGVGRDLESTWTAQAVEINRTIPSVVVLATTPQALYAQNSFTVYGKIDSAGGITSATLRYGDQIINLTASSDGAFSHTFNGGVTRGDYEFYVVATDEYGNTNEGAPDKQGRLTVEVFPQQPSIFPVVSRPILLEPLEKDITRRLSTNFSTPIATNRSVSSTPVVRVAARDDEMSAVLGSETEALERVLDLEAEAGATTLPVEATPRGWMIFGTPWYWWLTGGLAATGAGVYTFRSLIRRS